MKKCEFAANNGTFREPTTVDVAAVRRGVAASASLRIQGLDSSDIDSIIITLLEDILRAEHAEKMAYRVNPLGREEPFWNVCEDEPEELDAGDIAAGNAIQATLASTELPPTRGRPRTLKPGMSGKIVIAEDDEATRVLLNRVLTRAGFIVLAFENGQLACDAVRRGGADVVLLDWIMPIMDGPTAVARLKASLDTRGIPIVMLTAQCDIEERVVAFETGVQDFLTKPFNARELIARIEQQLRWRNMLTLDANSALTDRELVRYRPMRTDVAARIVETSVLPSFDPTS